MRTLPLLLGLAALAPLAQAADHRDSPLVVGDPAADINDVYTFVNPANPNELIVAATVLPLAGGGSRFSNAVLYRFHFEDTAGRRTLVNCAFPGVRVHCWSSNGMRALGFVGRPAVGNGMRVFAGLRDDPFFFDLVAFNETKDTLVPAFTNPGDNFFAGLNTLAIVLAIDSRRLGSNGTKPTLAVYASTARRSPDGKWRQIDRMGRPGINTALIDLLASTGKKDAYNRAANPATWAPQFQQEMADNLAALDTLDGAANALLPANVLASVLVDDRLRVNAAVPACDAYLAVELGVAGQCGGRTLARDVIDDTLGAVVGPGVSDFVGNDSTFLGSFPFLGPPN